MKVIKIWIFLEVMLTDLFGGQPPLQAQPPSEAVPAARESTSAAADRAPAPAEDEPAVTDGILR